MQLWEQDLWSQVGARGAPLLCAILIGAMSYGLAGLLLGAAWRELLGPAARAVPGRSHQAVYARTQIAKYLPGNLFHFAGRQLLGRRLGHGQAALAFASLAEAASLSALAGLLALPLVWGRLDLSGGWALVLAALAASGCALWLVRSARGRALGVKLRLTWPACELATLGLGWPQLLRAASLHAGFFVVSGMLLWLLALAAAGGDARALDPLTAIGALALAWLAGFVTPGASAGIGVREAVLILILTGSLGAEASTLVALAFRLVTTGGDALLFALGAALPLPADPPASGTERCSQSTEPRTPTSHPSPPGA
jgi:hypothetical protein